MVEFDNLVTLRKKLFESLGDRELDYKELMRLWYSMKLSKKELTRLLARFLTPPQLYLHNQYILMMLNGGSTAQSDSWKKNPAYCQAQFEPVDPIHCSVIERHPILSEQPPLMASEGTLLTTKMMMDRLQYGAWELELDGATSAAAEYLCIATKYFLKDVLTAIVCRRKGFKTKHNKFICGLGTPQLNPWLRNVPRGKNEPFHPLIVGEEDDFRWLYSCLTKNIRTRIDKDYNGFLVPNPRPARELLEQNEAFEMAASESSVDVLAPISLTDLAVTLKMHPSLVASNFVRTVNFERLYAKINHPTWDS